MRRDASPEQFERITTMATRMNEALPEGSLTEEVMVAAIGLAVGGAKQCQLPEAYVHDLVKANWGNVVPIEPSAGPAEGDEDAAANVSGRVSGRVSGHVSGHSAAGPSAAPYRGDAGDAAPPAAGGEPVPDYDGCYKVLRRYVAELRAANPADVAGTMLSLGVQVLHAATQSGDFIRGRQGMRDLVEGIWGLLDGQSLEDVEADLDAAGAPSRVGKQGLDS